MGRELWPGGYVRTGAGGRKTYVIEREVRGVRWHVSTRTSTLRSAMAQLEKFEASPERYCAKPTKPTGPVRMTGELIEAHLRWQLTHKQNSRKHVNACKHYLADWLDDLGSVDIREWGIREHLKPALDRRRTCRGYRIAALKGFVAWLRKEEGLLRYAEDVTLDLPVPQAQPEKRRHRKVVDLEHGRAALGRLTGPARDCLLLLASTGWHVTELERFVRDPRSALTVLPEGQRARYPNVLAVAVTWHKSARTTRTPIRSKEALDAAERLRRAGQLPSHPNEAIKTACRAAGVPEFGLGVMRHSFSTWMYEAGADVAQVSIHLDHQSTETTRKFYEDMRVPAGSLPPILLN